MLRDLEEVLLRVPEDRPREFLREAVRCYHAGAYRAAVVVAIAAAMDDLREKLDVLASAGGAPQKVKDGNAKVSKRYKDQDAFEAQLLDICEQDAEMVTPAEAKKLRLLLNTRHLCAHPSGHHGSPEEARDAITSAVELVLSRPPSLGVQAATALVDRVPTAGFFPNSNDAASVDQTVRLEIGALHASALPALVTRLIDKVKDQNRAAPTPRIGLALPRINRSNEVLFLTGMMRLAGQPAKVAWRFLGRLLEDKVDSDAVLRLIDAQPLGIAGTDTLTRERAVAAVRRGLKEGKGIAAAAAWRAAGTVLSEDEKGEYVTTVVAAVKSANGKEKIARARAADWDEAWTMAVTSLVEEAGSGTWTVANTAIAAVQELPPDVVARFSDEARIQYVVSLVGNRARGNYSANMADSVFASGLGPRTEFLDSFLTWLVRDPEDAHRRVADLGLAATLAIASGRKDELVAAMDALEQSASAMATVVLEGLLGCADTDLVARFADGS